MLWPYWSMQNSKIVANENMQVVSDWLLPLQYLLFCILSRPPHCQKGLWLKIDLSELCHFDSNRFRSSNSTQIFCKNSFTAFQQKILMHRSCINLNKIKTVVMKPQVRIIFSRTYHIGHFYLDSNLITPAHYYTMFFIFNLAVIWVRPLTATKRFQCH